MASLKDIKLKVQSYKKTGTVTHAMEAVSAVKMRKAQERALGGRAYAAAALSILERLAGTKGLGNHPLMQEQGGRTVIIVVTSDKGLAGSLNSAVIKTVEREMVKRSLTKENVVMVAVGRRGGDYFTNRGYEVREKLENVSDGISEVDVRAVTDKILAWHEAGEIGLCFVVYQNFLSTFEQLPGLSQLVPITQESIRHMVEHIRPAKGKYAPQSKENEVIAPASYTIEPDPDSVLRELLPRLVNVAVFHALLENKASEHSARMVAMKSATDKAKEMAASLTLVFNKARQAAITREVSEITSGIEAMK